MFTMSLIFFDEDGCHTIRSRKECPRKGHGEQSVLMKDALVTYFLEKDYIFINYGAS